MSKPGVFELTKQAVSFFASNRHMFWAQMKVVLPIGIILMAVTHVGTIFHYDWVSFAVLFPMILLQACFCLSWSRFSLGIADYKVNPFKFLKADWKFIFVFFALMFFAASPSISFSLFAVYKAMQGQIIDVESSANILRFLNIATVAVAFRFVFLLPAAAENADHILMKAVHVGKGLWWKIIGGFLIFLMLLFVTFLIYSGAIGVVAMTFGEGATMGGVVLALMTTLFSVPVFLGIMAFIALVTTMICRAYEHRTKDNAVI